MKELIKRLEEASEGSRELDAEIAVAVGHRVPSVPDGAEDLAYAKLPTIHDKCEPGTYWIVQRSGMFLSTAPRFTTSLDAALTLIPERWAVEAVSWWPGGGSGEVSLLPCHQDKDGIWWHTATDGPRIETEAKTPALALCIAALRAQEASNG